jgi:hypothetical protein
MADLTLTFSSPVTNPRLQFVGLGGFFDAPTAPPIGFATEFDLISSGLTLTEVTGNSTFATTATQINNGLVTGMNASCAGATPPAGCGTVIVNGSNITTVTFQVYIRGDGGAANWSTTTAHPGDQWLLGVSLPEAYNLSGNLFNDLNQLSDNTVNGIPISMPNGVQMYANLVNPIDGTVIGSVPINPDGTYSFSGIPGGGVTYSVEISTIQGVPLQPSPSRNTPPGWFFTGENVGSGPGSDGAHNGQILATVNNSDRTQVNFGISQTPTAASVTVGGRILSEDGKGLRGVVIYLVSPDGTTRYTRSSMFGYYQFDEVEAGQTYVIGVSSKRYVFTQEIQVITVLDNATDINFYAVAY